MKKSFYRGLWAIALSTAMFACNGGKRMSEKTNTRFEDSAKDESKQEKAPKEESKKEADVKNDKAKEREQPRITENPAPKPVEENAFVEVAKTPFSTFSVDVDNASYTQARRFILENGVLPPPAIVRLEEFVNYFEYSYPQPSGNAPFSVYTELGDCAWNAKNKVLQIGLKGKEIKGEKQASNLVFLIDVSGSMNQENKLPLLKKSFTYLLDNLQENDKVSIVVYAGAAGLVLPPTTNRSAVLSALNSLNAGGSTAGGEGLRLAYKIAEQNLLPNGNNRIILASDGDFNVGESSNQAMEQLVTENRDKNIFMTVLGFGDGNYQDERMEIIANKGNGNYYYIDNDNEARKVFGTGLTGTLHTIAKDVKIQLEFNPKVVKSYRLLGYENRMLNKEDFENDKKDAGEIGAGHTVTALYEVELVNNNPTDKLLTLNLRYKEPKGTTSQLLAYPISKTPKAFAQCSEDFRFASSVVSFGMLLRQSQYKGTSSYAEAGKIAQGAVGKDKYGYRKEFLQMVQKAGSVK